MKKTPPLMFGIALLALTQAQAQTTNNFTNASSASWTTASAWSLGVPTSAQDVFHTNVTTGTITTTVNTSAVAKTLTIGGSGGTATVGFNANQSLTVGGDITLAPGAGAGTLSLSATNITVTLNGGAGSIINGGGAGAASISVQNGFSNSLGLLNANVDELNMAQTGTATLIITNGQTYNVATQVRINNNNTAAAFTGTILMNGGALNISGSSGIRLNNNTGASNSAYLVLNSNALVTSLAITRANLGTDAAIEWNDGTIGNSTGTNLTISASAGAGTMNMRLAGTGTHTFSASSTNTITVAATAQLQDKTGEAGTLVKAGSGTLLLQGANTHSGVTTVQAGTLILAHTDALQNSTLDTGASGSQTVLFTAAGTNTYNLGGLQGADNLATGANSLSVGGNNTSTEYSGALSGTGGLTKTGAGTLAFSGANTYSGPTTVNAGALMINGDQSAATGLLNVAASATLGGSGTIGGATTISGILSPGNSIGTLTVSNNVTWNSGNNWVFELGAPGFSIDTAGSSDLLVITGDHSFLKGTGAAGSFTFDFAGTGDFGWYKLVEWSGGPTTFAAGDFGGLNLSNPFTSEFAIQDNALYVNVVPEPSTYALLALAAAGLGIHFLRRQRSARLGRTVIG